ncbi:MAG TPA: type II toxin-antitoxin system VapC family toxin [Herpetosiphonaceae bacterium]
MQSSNYLLDTDTLSAILRQSPTAISHAQAYIQVHGHFTFSLITRYEILRGLAAKNATRQMLVFDQFCRANIILPLSDAVIVRGAEIYADLHRRGELVGDADILIAATALVAGYGLVTNNERHFARISDLTIVNWLKE